MTQEEYAEMLSQAKDQFKSGTALFGKVVLFTVYWKIFLMLLLKES